MEIEGPYSQFADGSEYALATATGSTSSCALVPTRSRAARPTSCENIVAERVLGLPKLR